MRDPIQIVLILDVDKEMRGDDVRPLIPANREAIHILRLSEFNPPVVRRFGPEKTSIHWAGLGEAIVRMVAEARKKTSNAEAPVHYYVAGHAPLPVFALLGAQLEAWTRAVTVLNQCRDDSWAVVPLGRAEASVDEPFFDVIVPAPGSAPSRFGGRVAVFISCGQPLLEDKIAAFVSEQGATSGDIVEMRTTVMRDLDGEIAASAAKQLSDLFSTIRGTYPRASGFAVFVAGPAHLGVMVGRAISPTILDDVWIANFDANAYELAFSLPWRGRRHREISQSGEDKLARREVLDALNEGLTTFRDQFKGAELELLPPESFPITPKERTRFIDLIGNLKPLTEQNHDGQPFQLFPLHDDLSVSSGLLDALRPLNREERIAVGQCFILHEVFHISQDLRSSNHHGVGQADLALEEVDYWADAFAIGLLAGAEIGVSGKKGKQQVARIVSKYTGAILNELVTFNRWSQGDRIEHLLEARLRRYLLWHLQHARALTLQDPSNIWELFGKRVFVELAPLGGYLDHRGEKFVRAPNDDTELFVVLDGRLMRDGRNRSFAPGEFVEAVRSHDIKAGQGLVRFVVEKYEEQLAPWKARRGVTAA